MTTNKELRIEIGRLQRALKDQKIPVIILFEGMETAGIGQQINHLIHALDPRGYQVHYMSQPTRSERQVPWLHRFWIRIPAKGQIVIFDHSWYGSLFFSDPSQKPPPHQVLQRINDFEQTLCADGAILVKCFLEISRAEQAKRLTALSADPIFSWKVNKTHWNQQTHFTHHIQQIEQTIQQTHIPPHAPWIRIDAHDRKQARRLIAQTVLQRFQQALKSIPIPQLVEPQRPEGSDCVKELWAGVDLNQRISRVDYKTAVKNLQKRMAELQSDLYRKKIAMVVVYEGWDAAGKGGTIRRLTRYLDPRSYRVVPIGAPDDREKDRHYLWRFWTRLPKDGSITIFDRSWYGRLLVERVEGFASKSEWQQSFAQIRAFEEEMIHHGIILVKFWLHIDPETQLKRFESRQQDNNRQWKITEEDWRNRERWADYEEALDDVFRYTHTSQAPWTILSSNCKRWARLQALRRVCEAYRSRISIPPNRTSARTVNGG